MKLFVLALVALSLPAQIRQPAANIRFGSSLPSTCTASIGQVFFLTSASAGANVYGCTATNTWTVQGGSATIAGSISTGQICYGSASNTCAGSAGLTFTDAANVRLATLAGGSSQSTNALLDVTNSAGSSHWLTVLGDGKVGIGTNAPARQLHLSGSSTLSYLGITIQDTSATPKTWAITNDVQPGKLGIMDGSTYRLIVGSTGSVGIGTSNTTPANATLSILDATPASGATATWIGHDGSGTYSGVHLSALTTSLKVVAGLTQGSTNLQEWQNNAGVAQMSFGSGGLLFADNAYSIGASNASRPSSLYVVTRVNINNAASLRSTADGTLLLYNNGESDFNRLQFGGTTSSFPALKRSGTTLAVRLADDSADAPLSSGAIASSGNVVATGNLVAGTSAQIYFASRSVLQSPSDGVLGLYNNAASDFNRLQLGGTSASFPSLKRSTTGIVARLADDSADTWFQASQFRAALATPSTSSDTCVAGSAFWDANYVYICTATNTLKRATLSTF